jgi:hypothetical protein
LVCPYGNTICACFGGGSPDWNCTGGGGGDAGAGCPGQAPNPGSPCSLPTGTSCNFGQGNICACVANQWLCN